MLSRLLVFASVALLAGCLGELPSAIIEQPLFVNGQDGYACFRIPAAVRAPNGDILAFAEGRVGGCDDFGNVDIVLRTSHDNGLSWSSIRIVADNDSMQVGNPGPLVDLQDPAFPDGRVFLVYNSGTASEHETRSGNGLREVLYSTSADNGVSWSQPINITTSVHRPRRPDLNPDYDFEQDWRSYAVTPGHGIQLAGDSPYRGRLFVPANHSAGEPMEKFDEYRAHAFYSDDHGATWHLGESINVPSSNESIAVELSDGRVMQNIREQSGRERKRLIAISNDGGASWDSTYFESALPDPVCQASILAVRHPVETESSVLLFSNPATTDRRELMTIRGSLDDGQTWPVSRVIDSGPSAYSDLVQQEDGRIGLLYEKGNTGGIDYVNVDLNWLISSPAH